MLKVESQGNIFIIQSSYSQLAVTDQWFDPSFWKQNQAITGTSTGRNTTYFFQVNDQELVLRHYYRGGLVAKINTDSYRFRGIERTRAYRELALLEVIQENKLKSAMPIAARVVVTGKSYRADIIIEKIPHSKDAFQHLTKAPLSEDIWRNIGQTIQTFHSKNIYHADLNIHNILLNGNDESWLIDFDRGKLKTPKGTWREKNLKRLLRSLKKESNKQPSFHWQPSDWQALLLGYHDH